MAEAGDDANKDDSNNEENMKKQADENAVVEHQKHKELLDVREKAKLHEKLHQCYNNPMVLELYKSLFPENGKFIWSKHHSLVHHPRHRASSRRSSMGAVIATFMKK